MKSGKVEDVTDHNVRDFFRKALSFYDDPHKMFSLMNKEVHKWHTDRTLQLFNTKAVDANLSELFNTITCVVVELRLEAQGNRG